MVTPKEYKKELLANKVSLKMLGEVLYSYNKRAKNYRDKAEEYRHWRHCDYDYAGQARGMMEYLYAKKDKLLKFVEPIAIHKVIRTNSQKVFDWQGEFYTLSKTEEVYDFFDCKDDYHEYCYKTTEFIEYYLYYEVGDYSFHSPISETDLQKYSSYTIEGIGDLVTEGEDISLLLSPQFCDKVYNGLVKGQYSIVDTSVYKEAA